MIIERIHMHLIIIIGRMLVHKCSEIQHTVETANGKRFKFHIKELKGKNEGKKDKSKA